MKSYLIALCACLAIPLATIGGPVASDPYVGDWEGSWKKSGDSLTAQVIPRGKGIYLINFKTAFDTKDAPLAELAGGAQDGVLNIKAEGWKATFEKGKASGKGAKGGFALKQVTRPRPGLGRKPPKDAVVLFDGTNFDQWEPTRGDKITWQIEEGVARVWPIFDEHDFGTYLSSKTAFKNFHLHLEFKLPLIPEMTGQNRGNSGVIIDAFQFTEVQVLDSYGLEGKDDECGGIYKASAPAVNMCAPPLEWQSYDITYHAPVFEGGALNKKARITVNHNGVIVQDDVELPYSEKALERRMKNPGSKKPGRVTLQHHGDPVEYRNVWMQELN